MEMSEGQKAVEIVRKAIDIWVKEHETLETKDFPALFNEKRGVFVTIHTYPGKDLRGCIGYPEPIFPLVKAIVDSAINASQDPRFPPLGKEELDKIIVEVSVLTKPELISVKNKKDLPKQIKIGEDGLIVKKSFASGLLLPQVAPEYNLDAENFLIQTCMKAGLPPDSWLDDDCEIYKFQSEIFCEKEPNGEIERK